MERLTAIEVDESLAVPLRRRLTGTNVEVLRADATDSGLDADRFSAVACFSMLHHLPSAEDQDRLFAEVGRILRPGGRFLGVDSLDLDVIRDGHEGDTYVPVDPGTLGARLAAAGLSDLRIDVRDYQFRFVARKAVSSGSGASNHPSGQASSGAS